MLNSIEQAIYDFNFSNYGLDLLDELKSDEGARAWIRDLARKILENALISQEDHAITAELLIEAKVDVLCHVADELIKKGYQCISVRGIKVL